MVPTFAAMNALFISAIALGTAANAILLQNSAPFFVYFVSVYLLGEPADGRSLYALFLGMAGMVVIVAGTGTVDGRFDVTLMALGSGLTYGIIILCLRQMRDVSSQWLIVQNHLGSVFFLGLAILLWNGIPYWLDWVTRPTARQLGVLAVWGSIQMGLPYWLFARGLRLGESARSGGDHIARTAVESPVGLSDLARDGHAAEHDLGRRQPDPRGVGVSLHAAPQSLKGGSRLAANRR